MTRIAQHPVEIYECIVGLTRPNPVIDGLALGFQLGRPETGKRVAFNRDSVSRQYALRPSA